MRRNFSTSALLRLLGTWVPVDTDGSRQDVAERLGQWLGVSELIALQAAHQSMGDMEAAPAEGVSAPSAIELQQELQRLCSALQQSIIAALPDQPAAGYARYRQRHLELQRRMLMGVEALRERVRDALLFASPQLAQLAELDALMQRMLGAREQKLLSGLPVLLQGRFEQLRQLHADTALLAEADDWQQGFGQEFRQALLAELDIRLQPVTGMIEALRTSEAIDVRSSAVNVSQPPSIETKTSNAQ